MKPIKDKFILLFAPQPTKSGRRSLPLGLLAISAFLEKDGYDIRIYHSYDKEQYLEALEHLDKAICVGVSSMTGYQILDGLNFSKLVREKNKNVPIIWGGIHPTIKPFQTINHPLIDIVVRGQGEETFYELVKSIETKSDLKNILGIIYKENGKIIKNPLRVAKSINEFPLLPYHILDDNIESYIKPKPHSERNLPIITSDGCVFQCGFCYLATKEFKRKWDAYSPQRVADEIEYLVKKYNLSGVDVRDSNFFIDKERARQIFQRVIDKNLNIVFSGINGRIDQLMEFNDDFWQTMERAGVKEILVGVESGDQEMLDLINKGISSEMSLECERKAANHKINIINSFITGYPPTSGNSVQIKRILKKELNKTVELIRKIFEINPVANILLFFYTPYPGTPLYDLCLKNNFKDPQTLKEWGMIDLANQVAPWLNERHRRKTLFLRDLFTLKKVTSFQYLKEKENRGIKYFLLKYSGFCWLLNQWITLRLKRKFYFFPFEKLLFSLNKSIKKI